MKTLNMKFFYGFGCLTFVVFATSSLAILIINWSRQNIFTATSSIFGIAFNLLVAYLFFTLIPIESKSRDDEVHKIIEDLKNGSS